MFGFFKRKADVLNHWIAFADGFSTSPSEFYAGLEKEVADRQVPSMQMSRIEFPEGGLLSEKRIYLRMLRERLVFDVCAAPFGNGFFFSCRTAEIPIAIQWWHWPVFAGGALLAISITWYALARMTGSFFWSVTLLVVLLGTSIYSIRNAVALGLEDLDATLIKTPVFGPIYEVVFRRESYHRIDSRMCYLEVVPMVVKKLAEDTTAAKGVKLTRQYELAPVLGELYKPVRSSETFPPGSEPPIP